MEAPCDTFCSSPPCSSSCSDNEHQTRGSKRQREVDTREAPREPKRNKLVAARTEDKRSAGEDTLTVETEVKGAEAKVKGVKAVEEETVEKEADRRATDGQEVESEEHHDSSQTATQSYSSQTSTVQLLPTDHSWLTRAKTTSLLFELDSTMAEYHRELTSVELDKLRVMVEEEPAENRDQILKLFPSYASRLNKFLDPSGIPKAVFVGRPGMGKTTAIERILRDTTGLEDLELPAFAGGTTAFRQDFYVLGDRETIEVTVVPASVEELNSLMEDFFKSPEFVRSEITRAIHNLLVVFHSIQMAPDSDPWTEHADAEFALRLKKATKFVGTEENQKAFIQWIISRNSPGSKVPTKLTCENSEEMGTWFSDVSSAAQRMACDIQWPRKLISRLPRKTVLYDFCLSDMPGVHMGDLKQKKRVAKEGKKERTAPRELPKLGNPTGCKFRASNLAADEILIACTEFETTVLNEHTAEALRQTREDNPQVLHRTALLLISKSDDIAKIPGSGRRTLPCKDGMATRSKELLAALATLNLQALTQCPVAVMSAKHGESTRFPSRLEFSVTFVNSLQWWYLELCRYQCDALFHLLKLCRKNGFNWWLARVCQTAMPLWRRGTDEFIASHIDTEILDEIHSACKTVGHAKTLHACCTRRGEWDPFPIDLYKRGVARIVRANADRLFEQLALSLPPSPIYLTKLKVIADSTLSNIDEDLLAVPFLFQRDTCWGIGCRRWGGGSGFVFDVSSTIYKHLHSLKQKIKEDIQNASAAFNKALAPSGQLQPVLEPDLRK